MPVGCWHWRRLHSGENNNLLDECSFDTLLIARADWFVQEDRCSPFSPPAFFSIYRSKTFTDSLSNQRINFSEVWGSMAQDTTPLPSPKPNKLFRFIVANLYLLIYLTCDFLCLCNLNGRKVTNKSVLFPLSTKCLNGYVSECIGSHCSLPQQVFAHICSAVSQDGFTSSKAISVFYRERK